MGKWIRRAAVAISVLVLGLATQTVSASASTIHPMSFDNCGTNANTSIYNCMYINGSGVTALEVRGWSTGFTNSLDASGSYVHEEVVMPNGNAYCNSSVIYIDASTPSNTVAGCQNGPADNLAPGTWCSILWAYEENLLHTGREYVNLAENCGSVIA